MMRHSDYSQSAPNDYQFARKIIPSAPNLLPRNDKNLLSILKYDDFTLPPSPSTNNIKIVRRMSDVKSYNIPIYASSCPVSKSFGAIDDIIDIEKNWKSINSYLSPPIQSSTILSMLSDHSNSYSGHNSLDSRLFTKLSNSANISAHINIPNVSKIANSSNRRGSEDDLMFPMSYNDKDH